jgi:4-diphosphocytidyl-2-C-methyl-D-erythritol kinase
MSELNNNIILKKAFAKINLGLQVLNKRTDGFHNINTVFYKIKLHDFLEFKSCKKFNITNVNNLNLQINENLIYKAYQLLKKDFDFIPFDIKFTKNIPIGAGLGGGSSDAAETLKAIVELHDLKIEKIKLNEYALTLGSDVPYFLNEGTAQAFSRGEILTYFEYKMPYHLLLINPGIHISTQWAYKSLNRSEKEIEIKDFKSIIIDSKSSAKILKENIMNDFESIIFEKYPEIGQIKEYLYNNGSVFALMSGSGSSIFGLFEDFVKLKKCSEELKKYFIYIEMAEN